MTDYEVRKGLVVFSPSEEELEETRKEKAKIRLAVENRDLKYRVKDLEERVKNLEDQVSNFLKV